MKQKFFEIGKNQITLFPNEIWKMAGAAFAVLFPLCWLGFLIWAGMLQWLPVIIMVIANAIVTLPFFYFGSRQIIIDGNTQNVLRKSWFCVSKVYSFKDIEDVILVNIMVYHQTNSYYKLTLKKNPYGKGIQLNIAINKNTKQFAQLQNTAIPFIKKLLATNTITEPLRQSGIEAEAAGFTMFHQREGLFISRPFKIINLVIAVAMLGLGIFIMLGMENTNQFKKEYYAIFALVACIVNFGIWGKRIVLNPSAKTIENSYLGLFKKIYSYQYITGFSTLKHITGLGSNGIDIIVEIRNAATAQKITLFNKASSKKVQVLMQELKRILTV